jgi:NodT family efflux transporter outer membrane factor (OMF) lipoprotein
MKFNKIAILTLAAAMMSSCGVYKNYERPNEITANGIYGNAESGDSLGFGDLQWKEVFTDPTLQALIDKALAQNSNMRQADLRIEQAQNNLKAAKLSFFPSLAFAPSGTVSGLIDPYNREKYEAVMGNGASKTYSFPLSLNWQIDCFGQLRNTKKGREVALENMKTVRQAVQTALVANVANLYYTLAMLDEQLAIANETSEKWKKTLQMTKYLMEAGQSNKAAVASTEANYWSILSSVVELKNSIKEVENVLSALIGETPRRIDRSALSTFQTPKVCTTGMPITLLNRRPDVKQAELALASAFYNKNIAKASFYPNLTLSGNGQFANSISGAGIVNPGGIILAAVASLAQPIFQNGKLRAAYKNSKAEMEVATIGFQQALLDAGAEVNTAMANIYTSKAKKALIANQVKSLSEAVDATEKLMKESSVNYLQVLTAQSGLLQAQMNEVSNNFSIIQNTINLYQALGGGSGVE